MMKRDPGHIHALMTSWITGDLTREEAMYLKRLIDEDPDVRSDWMKFKQKFSREDIQDAFERYELYDWIPAEEITGNTPKHSRIYHVLRRASLAAAIITGIGIGWYLLNKPRAPKVPQPVANNIQTSANKEDIALQLANGQTVNLSTTNDSIQLADARLTNAGKTLSYSLSGTGKDDGSISVNRLTVPIGKDYKVTLSDGTEIWLNSATTLQFPFKFTGKAREISIRGEAYLKVAKHATRPFLVHTQHGTVQVLGTSFNINDYDSGIVKVALVDGAVRFATSDRKVTLKPGIQAVYTVNKGIKLEPFEEEDVLSWRTGKYHFSDAPLDKILTALPRWYGVNVIIDNPALLRQRFTGVIDRNKPIRSFLDNLSTTMEMSYYFDKEDVLHLQ
jgi:hypothetical protein